MYLIDNGNLISPEVNVQLMLRGLKTIYGKKYLPTLLKSFGVKQIKEFFHEDKYHLLSDFYRDIQVRVLTDHEYRESIGKCKHRVKLRWVKT